MKQPTEKEKEMDDMGDAERIAKFRAQVTARTLRSFRVTSVDDLPAYGLQIIEEGVEVWTKGWKAKQNRLRKQAETIFLDSVGVKDKSELTPRQRIQCKRNVVFFQQAMNTIDDAMDRAFAAL